ncbi:capsid maturation protease [Pseudomonas phage Dolphis]|nr:capsid maturation protease [Pseudomonas phage Dolphis]
MNEAERNSATNDYLSIGTMLKARPSEEGGERFIYLEAAREGVDQQNECVLAKALEDSAEHFLKFGNIDIDHKTMPVIAKAYGLSAAEAQSHEIGTPEDVRVDGKSVLVKARLYRGDTPLATNANMVWDSMTKLNPPKRWYASVGGATLAKAAVVDPKSGAEINLVTKVRWSNLAISQQPVNQHVSPVRTLPFGALAKCWTPNGFDMAKALEASYATDAAAKTGGAALGMRSLDTGKNQPASYFEFRDKLSDALIKGGVQDQTMHGLMQYASQEFSLSPDEAAEWVDRFLSDLKSSLSNRRQP